MNEPETHALLERLRAYGRNYPLVVIEQIWALLAETKGHERLEYPWTDLESSLAGDSLPLLGYGSLMNRQSAARTLSSPSDREPTPVLAFGGRRVYHYRIPDATLTRYPKPASPKEIAALNVVPTLQMSDSFNAVLIFVQAQNLADLRIRENNYDLIRFPYLQWNEPHIAVNWAYALSSPTIANGQTDETLMPHRDYHVLCCQGALTFGEEFARYFRDSSLLTDGRRASEY